MVKLINLDRRPQLLDIYMSLLGGYDGSFEPQECPKDVPTVDVCSEQIFTTVPTNTNKILENNQESEKWLEIEIMKEERLAHWISVVQLDDYTDYCSQ